MKNRINENRDAGSRLHLQNVKRALGKTTSTQRKVNRSGQSAKWLLLLVLLLFAAACGGTEVAEPEVDSAGETAVSPTVEQPVEEEVVVEAVEEVVVEEEMADMRTITDALDREVTLPVDPQRVVAMSEIDLDSLLALGIVPIGAPNGRGQSTLPTYLQPLIEGQTTSIGRLGEPNLETILTLEPDLIVFSDPYGELADLIPQLQEIAPVVVPYVDTGDWHWKAVFNAIADALDLSAEAEAWLADYDAETAVLSAQLPDEMREVSIVRWMSDGPRILLSNAFSSDVLSDVGFIRPEYQLELAGSHPVHTDVINLEQIEVVDADIVFVGGLNPEGDVALQEALENPVVQTLPSIQNGRFFTVDGLAWSSTGGPTAAMQVLNDVSNALTQVAERVVDTETAAGAEVEESPITTGSVSPLPRTVTDFEGNDVVIEDDGVVIAIDGPLTEIVFALGMGDNVVATDASSTYPVAATELPQVGYVRSLSAEPVLAMAPTLILTTDDAGPPEAIEQLQESGVTVVQFTSPSTIEESIQLVRDVAAALGVEPRGEALVAKMETDLAEAADLLTQVETTPRVMFIYARGVDTVSAAGTGTSIDVMFELAGVENAVTDWEGYQPLTAEGAVTVSPDALLLFESGLESVGGVDGLLGVPGLAETPAGDNENVHSMDGLLLTGLGPRVGEAVIQLIQMLHPELQ